MAGQPTTGAVPQALRMEVLKELQQLIDNREARDRLERSPLAETKGKEHWVLHLMLRAFDAERSHVDTLISSAYSNLLARFSAVEDRVGRLEEFQTNLDHEIRARFDSLDTSLAGRIETGLTGGTQKIVTDLTKSLSDNLDTKWKPVGESIETFAQGSRQILKDVADTYRVSTQTRLLLNENARRMTDLGRDIVALEESLKLVVAKTIEEAFGPLEQRLAALEAQLGVHSGSLASSGANGPPEKTNSSPANP
ncbi:MAG TPA: hypothetical protein VJS68_00885 [Thermoplasmata archaeon]|nr:hypothetical protein [Thermoplasmata archaeon]